MECWSGMNMYYICKGFRGSSSVGRASASQAEGHGFESRLSLSKGVFY